MLVANYLNRSEDELLTAVREATRVHQVGEAGDDGAVAAALVLSQLVTKGASIRDAVTTVAQDPRVGQKTRAAIQAAVDLAANEASRPSAFDQFNKGCALPGMLQTSVFILLTATSYEDAIRTNLLAAGDNCSRAIFIGACFAAREPDSIPAAWKAQTGRETEIAALTASVLGGK